MLNPQIIYGKLYAESGTIGNTKQDPKLTFNKLVSGSRFLPSQFKAFWLNYHGVRKLYISHQVQSWAMGHLTTITGRSWREWDPSSQYGVKSTATACSEISTVPVLSSADCLEHLHVNTMTNTERSRKNRSNSILSIRNALASSNNFLKVLTETKHYILAKLFIHCLILVSEYSSLYLQITCDYYCISNVRYQSKK